MACNSDIIFTLSLISSHWKSLLNQQQGCIWHSNVLLVWASAFHTTISMPWNWFRCKDIPKSITSKMIVLNNKPRPFTDLSKAMVCESFLLLSRLKKYESMRISTDSEKFWVHRQKTEKEKKNTNHCLSPKFRQIVSLSADLVCHLSIYFDFVSVFAFFPFIYVFSNREKFITGVA